MSTLNIKDISKLQILLKLLKDSGDTERNIRVTNIINKFPFVELSEFEALSFENVELVTEVLFYFLNHNNLIANFDNAYRTQNFLLRNIFFYIRQDGNLHRIYRLIDLFRNFLNRVTSDKNFAAKMPYEYLPELFQNLCNCKYVKDVEFQEHVLLTIIQVLKTPYINQINLETFSLCIFNFLQVCSTSVICNKINVCYSFTLHRLKYGLTTVDVVLKLIPYLVLQIEDCEKEEATILMCCSKLCFKLNIGDILEALCKNWILKEKVLVTLSKETAVGIELLSCIINYKFHDTPWEREDLLKQINLLNKTNYYNLELDINCVIFYLEFLYFGKLKAPEKVMNYLIKKLAKKIPTNPLVIKSAVLLFSAYFENNKTAQCKQVEQTILRFLEHQENLNLILTNHPALTIWILGRGSYYLKIRALKVWLNNEEYFKTAKKCVEICKCEYLLPDLLINFDQNCWWVKEISRPISDVDFIPNPISILFGNKEVCINIAKKLCVMMTTVIDDTAIKGICDYSVQLFNCIKNEPEILKIFISSLAVKFFIGLAKGKDDTLAESAILLLDKVITTQKNLKLWSTDRNIMELSVFLGLSVRRNRKALLLIQTILQNNFNGSIIQSENPAQKLHQKLMSISDESIRILVINTLNRLIKVQHKLSLSILNVFFIEDQCHSKINTKEFLSFLTNWLKIVSQYLIMQIPTQTIRDSLKNISEENKSQGQVISNILDRIQVKNNNFI